MSDGWRERANCRGMGVELFFDRRRIDEAKAVCEGCEVRPECLDAAVHIQDTRGQKIRGVWAGMEAHEIREYRLRLQRKKRR